MLAAKQLVGRPARLPSKAACLLCQHCNSSRTIPLRSRNISTQTALNARGKTFLERTRERIWGTDSPPGAEDPYTGRSLYQPQTQTRDDGLAEDLDEVDIERMAHREEREAYQESVNNSYQHQAYAPSDTWDGLEIVGGETQWDSGRTFQGFFPQQKVKNTSDIIRAIQRSAREVSRLHSTGPYEVDALSTVSEDRGELPLSNASTEPVEHLNNKITASTILDLDEKHVDMDISNSNLKLAIVHRFTQLTGVRVPDPLIQQSNTVEALTNGIVKRLEKPKTLFDDIMKSEQLANTSNVRILHRRETPVDKEVQVGRWKIIREQLVERDLPVLGRRPMV